MPRPIDGQVKAAILRDIRNTRDEPDPDRRLTRNAIAQRHGVSTRTVTNIANAGGLSDAFSRVNTEKGARASKFDAAFRRSRLIERFYDEADYHLDRLHQPHTVPAGIGPDGPATVTTRLPALRDAQAGMIAASTAVDKALRLEDRQGDGRVDQTRSLLGALLSGLQQEHGTGPDEPG